jgi:hypothetical protein
MMRSPDGTALFERAVTDDNGGFALRQQPARFRLTATHPTLGRMTTGPLDASELVARHSDPLVLVLGAPVELSGVVVDADGGPIARTELMLTAPPESDGSDGGARPVSGTVPVAWTTADYAGRFSVRAPSVGEYVVRLWARGFAAREVLVTLSGPRANERIELRAHRDLAGAVVDPSGHPAGGSALMACEGDEVFELVARHDGSFLLPARAVGCNVIARHPRFSRSAPTPARPGQMLRVKLEPGGSIRGLVTSASGHSVPRLQVEISGYEPADDETSFELERFGASSPLAREFHLASLAPGTYALRITGQSADYGLTSAQDIGGIKVLPGAVTRGVHVVFDTSSLE